MSTTRRNLLQRGLATALTLSVPGIFATRVSMAAPAVGNQRLVVVLMRGALDGLAAVPPVGDPHYAALRGELALTNLSGAIPLDDLFALHPSLTFLGEQWRDKQLAIIHAAATPYRERSHFDAQDVLEGGLYRPHASRTGWLNRSLGGLPGVKGSAMQQSGVALGAGVPLVLRGEHDVASWSPSRLPQLEEDTLQRLADLYAEDPVLSRRLTDALTADEIAGDMMSDKAAAARRVGTAQLNQTATTAAGFLVREDGPRVAVFETTGWDTHANEGADKGALAPRLAVLDSGLRTLRTELGPVWDQTAVLVVTEFGRTVAVNGTRGTDHGTGAAAFLLGGAVRGGRMIADWPGLAPEELHEGRDLRPTTDLHSVMKGLLRDHMGMSRAFIDREVFPDSTRTPTLDGLV